MEALRKGVPSQTYFNAIGYKPYPYQQTIHDCLSKFRTAIIGRQSGKSEVASIEASFEVMFKVGSVGWVVAPTYEQASIVFERVASLVKIADKLIPGKRKLSVSNRNLRITVEHYNDDGTYRGRTRFQGKSADNEDNLRGASLNYLIIDEAAMVDANVWNAALAPTLTTTDGWVLIITTPKGYNWVYDFYEMGLEEDIAPTDKRYASWQIPTWDANPSVPEAFFLQQKKILPERIYMQEFGAEFLSDSGGVFQNLYECPRIPKISSNDFGITMARYSPRYNYVIGADFARLDDFSVFTVVNVDTKEVVAVERINSVSWETQLARLKELYLRYPNSFIAADSNGVGDVLAEQMASLNIPFEGLAWRSNPIKESCINKLSLAIEHKRIILPDDDEYLTEFANFVYSKTPTGLLKMSAAGRGKDDRVASLAMAWHFVPEHVGGMLDIGDDDFLVDMEGMFSEVDALAEAFM